MSTQARPVHPYIPNSVPAVREEMLRYLGIENIESLYESIPRELRLSGSLKLPEPLVSEHDLQKHVGSLLNRNISCEEYASFLGAGCWRHFVPALCDEVNSRAEFLTAYAGDTYSDHGKHQAWFEFQSLLGELLAMDVVGFPTYDWATAASSALLMSARLTGRSQVLVPKNINPEKLSHMHNYCKGLVDQIVTVDYNAETGELDLDDLQHKISETTAAVYLENPTYFGTLESAGKTIAALTRQHGALFVVGVDPISLGVMTPPSQYGADIVCGDAQTLGIHMLAGTGTCGFIASHEDPQIMAEYPTLFETIGRTTRDGEWGFGWATLDRTSYNLREQAKDFTGTSTGLWAITAAVYMATLGPRGMIEVDEAIMQKSHFAVKCLAKVDGVRVPVFSSTFFKEFVVNFNESGKTVREINRALLDYGVFGGKDLSTDFPELGQSALYCVTEVTSLADIRQLTTALEEVLS